MEPKQGIACLLIAVVLLGGCAAPPPEQQPQLQDKEEVQHVVTNITDDIGGIQDTLKDIDQTFG